MYRKKQILAIRSLTNLPSVITHAQVKASLRRSQQIELMVMVRVVLVKILKIDGQYWSCPPKRFCCIENQQNYDHFCYSSSSLSHSHTQKSSTCLPTLLSVLGLHKLFKNQKQLKQVSANRTSVHL